MDMTCNAMQCNAHCTKLFHWMGFILLCTRGVLVSVVVRAQDAAKDVQSTLEYASLKNITSRVEIW